MLRENVLVDILLLYLIEFLVLRHFFNESGKDFNLFAFLQLLLLHLESHLFHVADDPLI